MQQVRRQQPGRYEPGTDEGFGGRSCTVGSLESCARFVTRAPERLQRRLQRLDLKTYVRACRGGKFEAKHLNDINGGQSSTAADTHARTVIVTVSRFCCEFSLGRLQGEFEFGEGPTLKAL